MSNAFEKRNIVPYDQSVAPNHLNVKMNDEEAKVYEWARNKMGLTRSDFARVCISDKINELLEQDLQAL